MMICGYLGVMLHMMYKVCFLGDFHAAISILSNVGHATISISSNVFSKAIQNPRTVIFRSSFSTRFARIFPGILHQGPQRGPKKGPWPGCFGNPPKPWSCGHPQSCVPRATLGNLCHPISISLYLSKSLYFYILSLSIYTESIDYDC